MTSQEELYINLDTGIGDHLSTLGFQQCRSDLLAYRKATSDGSLILYFQFDTSMPLFPTTLCVYLQMEYTPNDGLGLGQTALHTLLQKDTLRKSGIKMNCDDGFRMDRVADLNKWSSFILPRLSSLISQYLEEN